MSEAKTVAIIGAGPVGLAAAAHVLERGLTPIVLEAGDHVGHAMRQWGHVQLFSPWEYNIDRPRRGCWRRPGWNSPEPDQYPTGAELVERYLEPLATKTALAAAHSYIEPRHRHQPRRLRQAQDQGPRSRAVRDPLPERARPQESCRADAVIDASGTWHSPNPAGANGLPRHRRDAGGGPDRLRHARRAGQGPRALCRQDRRGARRRPFGDRHADRPRKARDRGAGNQTGLAVARQRSRQGLRRRRERQARRPRRARRGLRRAGGGGPDHRSKANSAFRISSPTALASPSAPAPPAAAVRWSSTN